MIDWPIKWKYGDRIFITGPSGCGKTTIFKVLLKQRGNVLLIDTKHSDEDGFDEIGDDVTTSQMRRIREGRFVWKADRDFILNPNVQSDFFFAALDTGPRAIGVDELYNLLQTPGEKLFVTQCRGKKVALIGGAQRPSGLSLDIVFNAKYYIVFFLPNDDDRKRVEEAVGRSRKRGTDVESMGNPIPWGKLLKQQHSFMIYNDRGEEGGPYRLKLDQ